MRTKVVLLGGLSRAGKAAFWPLFNSFKGMDQPQNFPQLDWYQSAFDCGDLTDAGFSQLVDLEIRVSSWFSYLGRYLNSNSSDLTNFSRLTSNAEYLKRIARTDTEETYEKYRLAVSSGEFVPIFTTDLELSPEKIARLNHDVRTLYVIRNPIRMYEEWMRTKRIERAQSSSSRMMKYHITTPRDTFANTTAKLILTDLQDAYVRSGVLRFEDYCQDPFSVLETISEITGCALKSVEQSKLNDARVPRSDNDQKLEISHRDGLSEELYEDLLKAQALYYEKKAL